MDEANKASFDKKRMAIVLAVSLAFLVGAF